MPANFQGAVSASEFVGSGAKLTGVAEDKVTKGSQTLLARERVLPPTAPTASVGQSTSLLLAARMALTTAPSLLVTARSSRNVVHAKKMFYKDGSPMIAAEELVDVFTTLRRAIDDEDTAEGVKQALSNALGGLIEKFEAMNDDG